MVLLPRYKVLVGLVAWLSVCGVWFLVYQPEPVSPFTTTGHYMLPSPRGHHARPPSPLLHHARPPSPLPHHARPPSPLPHHARPPSPLPHHARLPSPLPHHARPPSPPPHHARPPSPLPHHARPPSPSLHHARPSSPSPHDHPGSPQHPHTHAAHIHPHPTFSPQGHIENPAPKMQLNPHLEKTVQKEYSGEKKVKQYDSGNRNSIKGKSKSEASRMTYGNVIYDYDVSTYKGDYITNHNEDEGDIDKEDEYESYSNESDIDKEDEYDERQYEASENYEPSPEYHDAQATEGHEYDTDYADYEREDEEYEWTGGQYNVTPASTIMIYNRVPKCASSTMQTILRRLSRRLGFCHESSLVYNKRRLSEEEQMELQNNLTTFAGTPPSRALSYDRHLYYTNFTLYGGNRPVYINIIRDPVERFISSFYYIRSEERIARVRAQGHLVSPSLSWSNRTVGQCVLANLPECSFHRGEEKETMLTYFCGHHHFCRIVGSREALQVAKRVVSEKYSVVGLVEHLELSLKLMETLVPRYFTGALHIYENMKKIEKTNINSNHQKTQVSPTIRKKLMRRFANDLDFYNFLKQRLFQQGQTFLSH